VKKPPQTRVEPELIVMADGRQFWSNDNWQTIWQLSREGLRWRKVPESEADLVRFLAVAQSSAGP
jgi:hypothetical protein